MKIKITNDLFDIANRCKSIDKDYFIMYNTKTKLYELHAVGGINTFCLNLGEFLDAQALQKIYLTRVENSQQLYKMIDENNQKIEQQLNNNLDDKSRYQLKDIYSYCNNTSKQYDFNCAYQNEWV